MEISNKTKHDVIVVFDEIPASKTAILHEHTLQTSGEPKKIEIDEILVKKEENAT